GNYASDCSRPIAYKTEWPEDVQLPAQHQILYRRCFFFQAEDGIRDGHVTGVQTCALPIFIIWGWPTPGWGCRNPRAGRWIHISGNGRRKTKSINEKTQLLRLWRRSRKCGGWFRPKNFEGKRCLERDFS